FWVVRSAPRAEWLSRSEQGFDGFVAQDEERRHRPETGGECGRFGGRCPCRGVSSDHKRRGADRTVMGFAWCVRKPEPPRGRRGSHLARRTKRSAPRAPRACVPC